MDNISNFFKSYLDHYKNGWNIITNFFSDIWSGLTSTLSSFFQSYLEHYQNGINIITNFFGDFWDSLKGLFIPSEDYWESDPFAPVRIEIENKFDFIAGFKNAFDVFSNQKGQTLNYEFNFLGQHYSIDFSWYESHRLSIRSLFGAIFYVCCFLKCFKMISSVFNVEIVDSSGDGVGVTI